MTQWTGGNSVPRFGEGEGVWVLTVVDVYVVILPAPKVRKEVSLVARLLSYSLASPGRLRRFFFHLP